MNQVIRQLNERKSVRAFTERPITAEEKAAILYAAAQAPTAGNQQLYTILDITSQELKDRLAKSCDDQPFIAQAKLVLIFCADCRKWYDAYRASGAAPRQPGAGDLLLAVTDAAIAAQNAVVAAHSLGIGSCYIGDILENCEQHREMLCLPAYVVPAVMLVFGYPTQQQLRRPKPQRVDMTHVVHENGYRTMEAGELEQMWQGRCADIPYAKWMENFCNRKYNSDFAREMTRSAQQYLQQFGMEPKREEP